jgi:hypothetical protein
MHHQSIMKSQDIAYHRLANQHIAALGRGTKKPEDALALMGAIQAQDHSASLWAIGLRCENSARSDIEAAVAEKTIVRTWLMRGTLHYVASDDIHWILRLLAPRLTALSISRDRQLGLSGDIIGKSKTLFSRSLEGGRQLKRAEMYQVLEKGGISTTNMLGYHLLYSAATDGLICLGSHDGGRPTFTLLDEWVIKRKEISEERALAELASRYFTSRGPATVKDFVWWSGLKTSDARRGIEEAAPRLVEEEIDGKIYYMPHSGPKSRNDGPSTYLLPAFDEYLVGYSDRSAMLSNEKTQEMLRSGKIMFTHSNGIFLPTIVIDGEVVGTWQRKYDKGKAIITLQPFRRLDSRVMKDVKLATERYGVFLGLSVVVNEKSWTPIQP